MPVPTQWRAVSSDSANEHTAMAMALRGPTFVNTCGPVTRGTRTAAMSSSGARALRLGPTKNSLTGTERASRTDATSTDAPAASSGGWQSPAGEADPMVPRLRMGGDPMVRAAVASAGRSPASPAISSV
jgi:hypothetical protein